MKRFLLLLSIVLVPLWLGAKEEIVSFRLSSQQGLPDNSVRYMQQAPSGQLLLMMHYDAYSYDGYSFRRLSQNDFEQLKEASLRDHSIDQEHDRDNLGNRVVMSDGTLLYTDRQTGEQIRLDVLPRQWEKLTRNLKCRVVTDHEGRIWVSLNGFGLYVYNRQTRQLRHITKDDGSRLIDTNYLVYMMLDRDGNVWLSGEHYGLVCLQTVNQGYEVLRPTYSTATDRNEEVRMMTRLADGRVVMANNEGRVMVADSLLRNIAPLPTDGENYISATLDATGRLWLGSRVNGIYVGGRHYGRGRTDCLLLDSRQRLWSCGVQRSVSLLTLTPSGQFREQTFLDSVANLQPRMLIEDHRGDIWVATEQGLFALTEKGEPTPSARPVVEAPLRCLFEDSRHTLWLGTLTNGVLRADNSKGRPWPEFQRLCRADGLAGDAIQMIAEDGQGRICIATKTGCSVCDAGTGRIRSLYITDNPLRNYYEENSWALLADGRLALGTLDGIVVLQNDCAAVTEGTHAACVTSLYVNGEERPLPAGGWEGAHTENTLTLHASTFNYPALQQTDYAFFLEGYDRDWSEPSPLSQTSYKQLSPGHSRCT